MGEEYLNLEKYFDIKQFLISFETIWGAFWIKY